MDEGMKKNGDGKNPNGSYGKTKRGKYLVKLAKVKWYNGGEKGHIAKGFPHNKSDRKVPGNDPPMDQTSSMQQTYGRGYMKFMKYKYVWTVAVRYT